MSTPINVPNWRLSVERNRELTDELGLSPSAYLIGVNGMSSETLSIDEICCFAERQLTIVCDFTGKPKAEFKRDYSRARFLLRVARISEGKSIRYSEAIPTTKEDYVEFYDDFLKFFWLEVDSPDSLTDVDRRTLNVAADILVWYEEARGLGDRNL